ncbi:hypothetical protein HMPREF0379_1287 [[Eubacterium] yurii subsp. margaretiae ATCC 43715]|nr:hypothetical protein HMPREF0379_1287 [[Eubacterium] yurii subsp. margaretiae ATCC 43715]
MQNTVLKLNKDDKFLLALKWRHAQKSEKPDIDLMAIMLDKNRKLLSKNDFIFFNNLTSKNGALFHTGDNISGNSINDDETILVNLSKIPKNIKYIRFSVLNSCDSVFSEEISYRIAKMKDIFDNQGSDIYNYNFEDNDFFIFSLVELERQDDDFNIYIKNEKIHSTLAQILSRYDIQLE